MFLSVVSLFAMVLYFITSSDSGSLIIDCLATNGDFDSSPLLKAFWAIMEGVTATALIVAGGNASLMAVQTMAIMSASPMTIAICLMCLAAWRALKVTNGDMDLNGPQFSFQLFEPLAFKFDGFELYKVKKARSGALAERWRRSLIDAYNI